MTTTSLAAPTKLLVFAGSTRKQSFNRRLAAVCAQMGRDAGAAVTHIELADFNVPMYNADLEAEGTPADVLKLKALAYEHPAWIICSPEYNGSYTALLKNTIDWISSPVKGDPVWSDGDRSMRGKIVGIVSASNGALGGLRSLSHLAPLILNAHCWLAPKQYAVSRAGDAFDEQGALKLPNQHHGVQGVVEQVLWAAQRLSADPIFATISIAIGFDLSWTAGQAAVRAASLLPSPAPSPACPMASRRG